MFGVQSTHDGAYAHVKDACKAKPGKRVKCRGTTQACIGGADKPFVCTNKAFRRLRLLRRDTAQACNIMHLLRERSFVTGSHDTPLHGGTFMKGPLQIIRILHSP